MTREIDIKKMIKENPRVDRSNFEKAREAIRELRKIGIKDHSYDLEQPFTRSRISLLKDEPIDDEVFIVDTP